jgi:hypothetical protein
MIARSEVALECVIAGVVERFFRSNRQNCSLSSRNSIAAQKAMTHLEQSKGMVWPVL